MHLNILINGKTWADLEFAVEEVLKAVRKEYTLGFNQNESGSYRFRVDGDPEESDDSNI